MLEFHMDGLDVIVQCLEAIGMRLVVIATFWEVIGVGHIACGRTYGCVLGP